VKNNITLNGGGVVGNGLDYENMKTSVETIKNVAGGPGNEIIKQNINHTDEYI